MTETAIESISFTPIAAKDAQLLILGSMPGIKSLQQQQYYAHPRNAFWAIMAKLFNIDLTLGYNQRCQQLIAHKIAVWDVLKSCQRQGSLDQHIDNESMVANDFLSFLKSHSQITHLFFNGSTAEQVFNKQVLPTLTALSNLSYSKLPSTSPAHASMSFEEKLSHWQQIQITMEAD